MRRSICTVNPALPRTVLSIISPAPRTRSLHSVHCEIAICVVTRFVELGQVGSFSLAQLSVFHASINQASKTIVQKAALITGTLGRSSDSRSFNHFLDKKSFFV